MCPVSTLDSAQNIFLDPTSLERTLYTLGQALFITDNTQHFRALLEMRVRERVRERGRERARERNGEREREERE